MACPTDLKQVRGFVALASYYRKHIEHFANIARPLHRLSCKEAPFIWGPEQQAAFEELKKVLSSAPLVKARYPKDSSFCIRTLLTKDSEPLYSKSKMEVLW